jgi:hypothetical protein
LQFPWKGVRIGKDYFLFECLLFKHPLQKEGVMQPMTIKNIDNPIPEEEILFQEYRRYIVGQDEAIRRLVRKFTSINIFEGQMRETDKPAGIFFLFGTTGSGKTLLAEVTAKIFFGTFDGFTKIRCGEMQLEHQITTLTGAPPSYVGHDKDTLTQAKLDKWGYMAHTTDTVLRRYFELQKRIDMMFTRKRQLAEVEQAYNSSTFVNKAQMINSYFKAVDEQQTIEPQLVRAIEERDAILQYHPEFFEMKQDPYDPKIGYPSIVLIDEFEKANDSVRVLLLEMLDKAELTIQSQSGETISFRNTFFFFTSNIAQEKMLQIIQGSKMGFSVKATTPAELKKETERVRREVQNFGYEAITKSFSPEFVGRVGEDNIFAFAPPAISEYEECLRRIILPNYNLELAKYFPLTVEMTDKAQDFVIGCSLNERNCILGMRALNNEFKRLVRERVTTLIANNSHINHLMPGDRIVFDFEDNGKPDLIIKLYRDQQKSVISGEEFAKLQKKKKDLQGDKGMASFKILPE